MSLDSSLKIAGALTKHRNVLTRAERIERLASTDQFNWEKDNPLGLPKVANRKVVTGGKSKKDKEAEQADEQAVDQAEGTAGSSAPNES